MRAPIPRPRASGITYMRFTSAEPSVSARMPPQATARPSSYATRNVPRGASYSDATVFTRAGSRSSTTSISPAYESSRAVAAGSPVGIGRTSSSAAIRLSPTVTNTATDFDRPVGSRARVQQRASALADLQRTADECAKSERSRARRLVLGHARTAGEHPGADHARLLVDP